MILEIGNKPLKEMTQEDLRTIVIIEGCSPSLKFWREPEVLDFDNKMFSDTLVLDYVAYRQNDELRSSEFTFFFDFVRMSFHYNNNINGFTNLRQSQRVGLATLRYLIQSGYDIPIYPI